MLIRTNLILNNLVDRYILDNIDLLGYDTDESGNPLDNLKEICLSETRYKNKETKTAIMDWLQGLPSSLTIAFMNEEIEELQVQWYRESAPTTVSGHRFGSWYDVTCNQDYYELLTIRLISLFNL